MRVQEIVDRLELGCVTRLPEREISGVYISDMVSDIIANARPGNLLVTVQIHNNVIAAANLADLPAIIVVQGKPPSDDVVKMAEKAQIAILSTPLSRWQVATKLYEAGIR